MNAGLPLPPEAGIGDKQGAASRAGGANSCQDRRKDDAAGDESRLEA
jgi:hypothetical protein